MNHPAYALLYVDSPEASARFYAGLLGTEPVESSPGLRVVRLALRHDAGPVVAPHGTAGAAGSGRWQWRSAFAWTSDAELTAAHADWSARGVRIVQAPVQLDFGRAFLALDPDGHRLRVYALTQEG